MIHTKLEQCKKCDDIIPGCISCSIEQSHCLRCKEGRYLYQPNNDGYYLKCVDCSLKVKDEGRLFHNFNVDIFF